MDLVTVTGPAGGQGATLPQGLPVQQRMEGSGGTWPCLKDGWMDLDQWKAGSCPCQWVARAVPCTDGKGKGSDRARQTLEPEVSRRVERRCPGGGGEKDVGGKLELCPVSPPHPPLPSVGTRMIRRLGTGLLPRYGFPSYLTDRRTGQMDKRLGSSAKGLWVSK
jgi:hypothetical protein